MNKSIFAGDEVFKGWRACIRRLKIYTVFIILSLMFAETASAKLNCRWTIEVRNTDKTKKSYDVTNEVFDIPISGSKWSCKVTLKTAKDEKLQQNAVVSTAELICQREDIKIRQRHVCAKTEMLPETLSSFGGAYLGLSEGTSEVGISIDYK